MTSLHKVDINDQGPIPSQIFKKRNEFGSLRNSSFVASLDVQLQEHIGILEARQMQKAQREQVSPESVDLLTDSTVELRSLRHEFVS